MRSVLVYIAIYFGVFLLMHRMFRRWWYGLVGAVSAVIVSLAPQLLTLGIWPTLLAALLVVGLNLAILRDLRIL
jgi:hypothetical protein